MRAMTEQERFWKDSFGDEYIKRNCDSRLLASNLSFFSHALRLTNRPGSVLELGSNIGMNLMALRQLLPAAGLSAVEINKNAADQLRSTLPEVTVHNTSIFDFSPPQGDQWELVFTKGVLIHIAPELIPAAYETLYRLSSRCILIAEYYNPSPVDVTYRGEVGKLFKRDFAGEFLDIYKDTALLDYGFVYHRDPLFPQDDITWFLIQKT